MRSKYALIFIFCAFFFSIAPGALAQHPNGIFVTPIANEPFMAVVNVQRTQIQPDGTVLKLKTTQLIARTSQGKIYNEARMIVPETSTATPPILVIHLYDPQTRTNTFLYPQQKTGWQGTNPHPPPTVPPDLYATTTGNSLPVSQFTKEEELGTRTIEGVPAHGVREIQVIPASASTGNKEVTVTDEYWYSDDLRLNLIIKHDDPRTGSVIRTVTQVTRTEPDADIFLIRDGYNLGGPNVRTNQNTRTNQ